MKWNDDLQYDSWAEWKAAMLNRLFFDQGQMRKYGRITPQTVQRGERYLAFTARSEVQDMPRDPKHPGKHIDPKTNIWPISEWGPECYRGFVDVKKDREE